MEAASPSSQQRRSAAWYARNKARLANERASRRADREVSARVAEHDQLVRALRARRIELGWSQLELDDRAGLQTGYTGKIECGMRGLGRVSLNRLLGALGLELYVARCRAGWTAPPVDLPQSTRHRPRVKPRG